MFYSRKVRWSGMTAMCALALTSEGGVRMADHPIVHVEIPAHDAAAAGQFYAQVFHWQIDEAAPGYWQFKAEGGPGGLFVSPGKVGETALEYKPGEVLIYLSAGDAGDID